MLNYQRVYIFTFEVSESMFEVSGRKSGWYDHHYQTKSMELALFEIFKNGATPRDISETKSTQLEIFCGNKNRCTLGNKIDARKQNRCTWSCLGNKLFAPEAVWEKNRCTRGFLLGSLDRSIDPLLRKTRFSMHSPRESLVHRCFHWPDHIDSLTSFMYQKNNSIIIIVF